MLRIIAGEYKSRRLLSPPDASRSRPYTQRLKESVFNILRGRLDGANVLDLFAGVGTIGLEAVSRGARMVLMVEHSTSSARHLPLGSNSRHTLLLVLQGPWPIKQPVHCLPCSSLVVVVTGGAVVMGGVVDSRQSKRPSPHTPVSALGL